MIHSKQEFMLLLEEGIVNHPDKESILAEYEVHISELIMELGNQFKDENKLMEHVISRLGTPEEIAQLWIEESSITPSKTKWLFFFLNILFFAGGSLLTIAYHIFEWVWLNELWAKLTGIPATIIIMYMVFWALLGYEIGKSFGHGGRKLLKKTFLIALLPNIILMNLVLFRVIPLEWFQPLLSTNFILVCVGLTFLLYPISWMGYRWGKKVSV
jgi:hypothetical protein